MTNNNSDLSYGTVTFSTLVSSTATTKISLTKIINENTVYGTAKISSGLSASKVELTYINSDGTDVYFLAGLGYIKFTPTGTATSNYGSYVDFKVEEADVDKIFGDIIIEFDASRVGTSTLNLLVEAIFKGDGSGTTGKILTETNYKKYTLNGSWINDNWQPASTNLSGTTNTNYYSHFKYVIHLSDMPEYAYAVTLRIYDLDSKDTSKSFLVENVKMLFGDANSAEDIPEYVETTTIPVVQVNSATLDEIQSVFNEAPIRTIVIGSYDIGDTKYVIN